MKIKKRIITVFTLLICILGCLMSIPSQANAAENVSQSRLNDMAGLLSENEREGLAAQLDEVSSKNEFDVVIVTTDDLDGMSIMDYADDYFDYNGFGYNSTWDGLIFVRYINGSDRDVWISTCGLGQTIIYDDYIDHLFDNIADDFSVDDYYSAFSTFINDVDYAVSYYKNTGSVIDIYSNSGETFYYDEEDGEYKYYENGQLMTESERTEYQRKEHIKSFFKIFGIITGIGLLITLIILGVWKAKLKSVKKGSEADNYFKKGSFSLNLKNDTYLRSSLSKIPKSQGSSGGGHGSSSHHSSSGRSHGGGGRHM